MMRADPPKISFHRPDLERPDREQVAGLWGTAIDKADALVSSALGTFIALNIMLGSGFLLFESARSYPLWEKVLCSIFFVWCLATELWFVTASWDVVRSQQGPSSIALAMKQPRVPRLVRLPLSLWWIHQLLSALFLGMALTILARDLPFYAGIAIAVLVSGFAYLTFAYFLLAITSFTRHPALLARVWKWRVRWAAAHGLIVLLTGLFVAPHVVLK